MRFTTEELEHPGVHHAPDVFGEMLTVMMQVLMISPDGSNPEADIEMTLGVVLPQVGQIDDLMLLGRVNGTARTACDLLANMIDRVQDQVVERLVEEGGGI